MRTYLDHNATSPLRPDAKEAMLAAMDGVATPLPFMPKAAPRVNFWMTCVKLLPANSVSLRR